jgi:hypothetical protein
MVDFNKRVVQSGLLNPGEAVMGTSFLNPVGLPQPGSAAFGLAGFLVSKAMAKRRAKNVDGANPTVGLAAGFPNKTVLTIAATNQRIMVMSNKSFSGKPKEADHDHVSGRDEDCIGRWACHEGRFARRRDQPDERRPRLAGVAQAGRKAVECQLDAPLHEWIVVAVAVLA